MMKKVNRIRGLLSLVIIFSLFVCMMSSVAVKEFAADENIPIEIRNPVYDAQTDTTTWDYVYFGNYPQTRISGDEITEDIINAEYNEDGDAVVNNQKIRRMKRSDANYTSSTIAEGFFDWKGISDGYVYFKYEPVKWRVLQNEGDTLLLLSDTVLDCQRYERKNRKVKWSDCTIRNWLNANFPYNDIGWSFMLTAFNKEEEAAIVTSNLSNPSNPFHGTSGGADTKDKIFFMSVEEMTNEAYGFPSDYMTYSKTRQLGATDYAKAMGVWMGSYNELYNGNTIWMLRTPGSYPQTVSLVYWFGHVYQDGYYTETPYYGVAPAIRVDASSDLWTYAGRSDEDVTAKSLPQMLSSDDITIADVCEALSISLGIKQETANEIVRYDVDRDGAVRINDVCDLLRIALGIISYPQDTSSPDVSDKPIQSNLPIVTSTPTASQEPTVSFAPSATPTEGPLVQKDCDPSGRIWIAGDSIADYHSKDGYSQPLYGWGELFGNYFEDNDTLKFTNNLEADETFFNNALAEKHKTYICNNALSSRSSKSFTYENNYLSIKNLMDEGDYLLISFGHNDERADVQLYTDPFGSSSDERSFKWYLKNYYIDPAIRSGVQPVLISPVTRRYFYKGEFINPQLHTTYGKAMKELTEEYAKMGITVYYIDLHSYMLDMYEELGEEGTIQLHGKYGDTMDNTHLSKEGATIVSEYIISKMVEQNMSIKEFIKEEYK